MFDGLERTLRLFSERMGKIEKAEIDRSAKEAEDEIDSPAKNISTGNQKRKKLLSKKP